MKYVIINVYDREIMKVGVANTPTEATKIMKKDFIDVFTEHYDKEDFKNEIGRGDEWNLHETEAWLNTSGDFNYDWRIVEVE